MNPANIWLLDDDASIRYVLTETLQDAGYRVQAFEASGQALQALQNQPAPDVMFTDIRMPGGSGLDFLEAVKRLHPALPVIVMSAYTDIRNTAGAYRGGAFDYLAKPFNLDDVLALVEKALPAAQTEPETDAPVSGSDTGLVGHSPAMRELFRHIGRMAQVPLSVLITGETGTGKELVARALHQESPRAGKPFVALNTAAIPDELLESELFGHEAGAFTGATARRIGRFEQAQGGTLFLDEIGDMPSALQTRLLRVLAEGEFYRVGGRELIRVDVRVIAATHQPLETLVASQRFRADVLHRLNVLRIELPPLRARKADIPALTRHFFARAAEQLGGSPKLPRKALLEAMQAYDWPGNVRELENACWRMASGTAQTHLAVSDWQHRPDGPSGQAALPAWEQGLYQETLQLLHAGQGGIHALLKERFDSQVLDAAVQFNDGHRQQAALSLGLGRNTLTRKLGAKARRKDSP